MTVFAERPATKSLRVRVPRADWIAQQRLERQLWIARFRQIGNLTLTGNERIKD